MPPEDDRTDLSGESCFLFAVLVSTPLSTLGLPSLNSNSVSEKSRVYFSSSSSPPKELASKADLTSYTLPEPTLLIEIQACLSTKRTSSNPGVRLIVSPFSSSTPTLSSLTYKMRTPFGSMVAVMRPGAAVTFEKYLRTVFSSGSEQNAALTKQSINKTIESFFMELWPGAMLGVSLTTRIGPVECWIESNAVRHLYLPAAQLIVAIS